MKNISTFHQFVNEAKESKTELEKNLVKNLYKKVKSEFPDTKENVIKKEIDMWLSLDKNFIKSANTAGDYTKVVVEPLIKYIKKRIK